MGLYLVFMVIATNIEFNYVYVFSINGYYNKFKIGVDMFVFDRNYIIFMYCIFVIF